MSTTVMSDAVMMPVTESQTVTANLTTEVEFAECDCCGLMEECTPAYMERIRERYKGKWICGLCREAVKEEIMRSGRLISTDEAMTRYMMFRRASRSSESIPEGKESDETIDRPQQALSSKKLFTSSDVSINVLNQRKRQQLIDEEDE
ncbi:uncharacterized protein LOC118492162 [Helianthus annuus]|uniref:uncharacterized protein LOC118492162 n=1 Tax=Helianthus annuus TaxID=4232 RepID=UPI001652E235|nr:uncharacterized protein LOC118492162 [Helianthus annuus]